MLSSKDDWFSHNLIVKGNLVFLFRILFIQSDGTHNARSIGSFISIYLVSRFLINHTYN
jgi:hypothetical protein